LILFSTGYAAYLFDGTIHPAMGQASLLAAYHSCRWIVFVAKCPRRPACLAYVGLAVTTLGIMALLLVVSFSMAALSNEQPTSDLRARTTRDGMTGLLNGAEFLRLATAELRRHSRGGAKSKGRNRAVWWTRGFDMEPQPGEMHL
jgi:hypothetical protein